MNLEGNHESLLPIRRSYSVPVWITKTFMQRLYFKAFDWLGIRERNAPREARALKNRLQRFIVRQRAAGNESRISVGFLVCDGAKWSAGSLFQILQNDPDFHCGFVCALSDKGLRLGRNERRNEYDRQRAYFSEIGPIHADLYDSISDRIRSCKMLKRFDIIFIQQPWGMQDLPRLLSGNVLTAYIHYGFSVINNDRMQFGLRNFHPYIWCYFAQTEIHRQMIVAHTQNHASSERNIGPAEVVVTGYPKLDAYMQPPPNRCAVSSWPRASEPDRRRVIYAPHHSIDGRGLDMGTFAWSAKAMLSLAQKHPEVDFILKPHPNLELALQRSEAWTSRVQEDYFRSWRDRKNTAVFDGAPYFDLFRSSDVLITDSGSFLAEYLPTLRPIIRLVGNPPAALNENGIRLSDAFYTASNETELFEIFDQLVVSQVDPKIEIRRSKVKHVMPFKKPAAELVHKFLREELGLKYVDRSV